MSLSFAGLFWESTGNNLSEVKCMKDSFNIYLDYNKFVGNSSWDLGSSFVTRRHDLMIFTAHCCYDLYII